MGHYFLDTQYLRHSLGTRRTARFSECTSSGQRTGRNLLPITGLGLGLGLMARLASDSFFHAVMLIRIKWYKIKGNQS